jgi:hypothetical protein
MTLTPPPNHHGGRPAKGPLAEARWELFCQAKARGASNSNATRAAGYAAAQPHQTANSLMKKPEIQARIAELEEYYRDNPPPEAKLPEPSLEWVTEQYVRAIEMSRECEDRSSMISGLSALAKLKGYMVDRTETRTGPLDALSAEQLRAMISYAEKMANQPVIEAEVKSVDPEA